MIGTIAIAGFPPFGVFTSEFPVLTATIQQFPWLTPFLLLGIGIAFAGLFRHIQPVAYGSAPEGQRPAEANLCSPLPWGSPFGSHGVRPNSLQADLWPVMAHLVLVLWLGLAVPGVLPNRFGQAAQAIAGSSPL